MSNYICPKPCKQATKCSHRRPHHRERGEGTRKDNCVAVPKYCPDCKRVEES